DERINRRETVADGRVRLLFGIAAIRPAEFHAWLITYQRGGTVRDGSGSGREGCGSGRACTMRSVAVNRLATSQQRVDWEIETAILRG
ncbi:MAG: hypothetical protein ACREUG_06450, partial [Steroidobacteraceae bacterium]